MDEQQLAGSPSAIALSVILVANDGYDAVRPVIQCLKQQSACNCLELLIVVSDKDLLTLDASVQQAFGLLTIVEVGNTSIDSARAHGVWAASGAIVAFAEDHAFPESEWASAIIQAHQGPWTAVSPAISNANAQSMLSWADFLLSYGDWFQPIASREVYQALVHNGTFKRQALLQLGDALSRHLSPSGELVQYLLSTGNRLYLESQAVVNHLNISRLASSVWLWFCLGRSFAARRALRESWSLSRRCLYVALLPAIPALRLRSAWPAIQHATRYKRLFPAIVPWLVLVLVPYAFGEALGYAVGIGNADQQLESLECNRFRFLSRSDQYRMRKPCSAVKA